MSIVDKFIAIANGFRSSRGITDKLSLDEMATLAAEPMKLPQVIDRTVTELTAEDFAGVTSIGSYAFRGCRKLKHIEIPDSVTSIEEYAFYNCESENLYYNGDTEHWCNIIFDNEYAHPSGGSVSANLYFKNALGEYELVTNLIIPNTVTEIKDYAFRGCLSITSVMIPNGVTTIGQKAFYWCRNIKNLWIPNTVTEIKNSAFLYMENVDNLYYDGDAKSWCEITRSGKQGLSPFSSGGSANLYFKNSLGEYELVTNLIIPNTVTEIKNYAFRCCLSITSVIIPNGVTKIEKETFFWCKNLTDVTIGDGVTSIDSQAFYNCSNLKKVRIGNGITSIYSNVFGSCSALTDIYIDKEEDSISGAPWGAKNATVHWNTPLPTEEA